MMALRSVEAPGFELSPKDEGLNAWNSVRPSSGSSHVARHSASAARVELVMCRWELIVHDDGVEADRRILVLPSSCAPLRGGRACQYRCPATPYGRETSDMRVARAEQMGVAGVACHALRGEI